MTSVKETWDSIKPDRSGVLTNLLLTGIFSIPTALFYVLELPSIMFLYTSIILFAVFSVMTNRNYGGRPL